MTLAPTSSLLDRLGGVCTDRGLPDLAARLADLHRWIRRDLAGFEAELGTLPTGERIVQRAAHHLLDLGGKHLRPMCVALAARVGGGFDERARALAVAVELVHTATLLHDDVVDQGDSRRGAPAARCLWGNAASVFAGDWLLVQALLRIRHSGVPGALDRMLAIIDEMIMAESLQLERRGRLAVDLGDYFRVVEGKTAALFRWAMWAGGRAGGVDDAGCAALERFGLHLGVAFQVVDDLLDVAGDERLTGKGLHADLREGKMTYPLALAAARDPELAAALAGTLAADLPPDAALIARLQRAFDRTGALADARALADTRIAQAIAALDELPAGPARAALVTVAEATAQREM